MKKKVSKILDIPTIQQEIHKRHEGFISKYGLMIEKVMADHRLFTDIVLAKLNRILLIFKQEMIIDDIQIHEQGPFKKVVLTKKGYDTYITLETNGAEIALQGYTYTSDFANDFTLLKRKIKNINTDDFDWVNFSIQLVEYIHSTIYERQEVVSQKLNSIFIADTIEDQE